MLDSLKARAEGLRNAVPEIRTRSRAVDTTMAAVERDADIGGPLVAGAIAFRLFVWMLPLILVLVEAFGFAADAASQSPGRLAQSSGISGIAAQSIVSASNTSKKGRLLLLAIALWALLVTSRSLVRVLRRAHEIAWGVPRTRMTKSWRAVAFLLLLAIIMVGTTTLASRLRAASPGPGFGAGLVAGVFYGGAWLIASLFLPHRGGWQGLIPGAVLVGLATEALHLFTVYFLSTKVSHSSQLYGGLGAAAALLTWLYVLGRVLVGSAVLNATLSTRAGPVEEAAEVD
jgi:uncharacterized BrkB/YihY/UPF0761 family membrane protein